jgi:hypothetical protein
VVTAPGTAAQIVRITTDGSVTYFPLPNPNSFVSEIPVSEQTITAGPDGALWFLEDGANINKIGRITTPATTSPLLAAVVPSSRSVQVGSTATAFATIINSGNANAGGCAPAPVTSVPANFTYQTTDPVTNVLIGSPNTPALIPAGNSQSFVIALAPNAPVVAVAAVLGFSCNGIDAAPSNAGLNTLLYSAWQQRFPTSWR